MSSQEEKSSDAAATTTTMESMIKERRFAQPEKILPLSSPSLAQTHCQGPLRVNGSGKSLNADELAQIKQDLEELKAKHGWKEPERQFMDDPFTVWMFDGVPDYSLTNWYFLKERTYRHAAGSLEETVENLVKSWEMERSHKPDCTQHQTTDAANFRFSANGGKVFNNVEAHQVGNYNVLLDTCPKEYYNAQTTTWQDSHHAFHKAFPAFPWEVLQVFAGPPKVAFTWRHWAHFTGTYQDTQGQGQLVEMFGFCTAVVNDQMQIGELQVYFDPVKFFEALLGEGTATNNNSSSSNDNNNNNKETAASDVASVSAMSGLTDDITELSLDSSNNSSEVHGEEAKSPGGSSTRRTTSKSKSSFSSSSGGGGCPFAHSMKSM